MTKRLPGSIIALTFALLASWLSFYAIARVGKMEVEEEALRARVHSLELARMELVARGVYGGGNKDSLVRSFMGHGWRNAPR